MRIQGTEKITEYDGAAKPLHGGHAGGRPVRLDFSVNLNPLGMPACVRQAVLDSDDAWEHYPDPYCGRLRQLLAEQIAERYRSDAADAGSDPVAAEPQTDQIEGGADLTEMLFPRIMIGNGADDLIFRIVQAMRPRRALLITPTFSEYENALRQNGCSVLFYDLKPENDFDLTADVLAVITEDIDLLFLCNPNNPTGRLIDPVLLDAIIRRCGDCSVTLVIDECFLPFVPDERGRSALRYLSDKGVAAVRSRHQAAPAGIGSADPVVKDGQAAVYADVSAAPHMIVLRAFTKIFAMPGLRLGYCVCGSRDIACRIWKAGQFWSVSAPALAAGEALLTGGRTAASDFSIKDYANQTMECISRERAYLEMGLQEAGIVCIPSQANFIFCRSDLPLYELLLREGILIRDCSNIRGLGTGWFRIAVRTHAENMALIAAVKKRRKGSIWHIRS